MAQLRGASSGGVKPTLICARRRHAMAGDCALMPKGGFGIFVQGLLFLVSIGVLVLKFKKEGQERTLREFMLDSSKQLFGAGWIHFANMGCAMMLGSGMNGNGCEWYWVNIVMDCTLGVYVEYHLLHLVTYVLESVTGNTGDFRTGEYKDEKGNFHAEKYVKQLMAWALVVTGMKFIMVFFMVLFSSFFMAIARTILAPVKNNPRTELIVVMIITPCFMNALQFWLTDNFIKKHDGTHARTLMEPMVDEEKADIE